MLFLTVSLHLNVPCMNFFIFYFVYAVVDSFGRYLEWIVHLTHFHYLKFTSGFVSQLPLHNSFEFAFAFVEPAESLNVIYKRSHTIRCVTHYLPCRSVFTAAE